jgi:hypothetical protein
MQRTRLSMLPIVCAPLVQRYPSTPYAAPGVYYPTLYAIALARPSGAEAP